MAAVDKAYSIDSSRAHGEPVTVPHAMNWRHVRSVLSSVLDFPFHDVTDLEGQKVLNAEDCGGEAHALMEQIVIRDRLRAALRAFSMGGPDCKRVRRAAQFLHRAEVSESAADSYLAMATALEGLLVDGTGDLSARVADAVAFIIGTSHSDRVKLRALAKKLYDIRSKYIHEGNYSGDEAHRHECLRMVERVVWYESRLLQALERAKADAAKE